MLIPFIPRDPDANDFTCRDGEIDFAIGPQSPTQGEDGGDATESSGYASAARGTRHRLTPEGTFPTTTLRIALLDGEAEKATLLLGGEISRVDPATAERLTQAIVQKAAEYLLDLSCDLRRRGLFILPFRVYSLAMTPDGTTAFPTAQAAALTSDFPPHPEITAAYASADTLTISLRIPVRPHRLDTMTPAGIHAGCRIRTFISYPLYIPDPKEMRGSIGSVRSATGGNATGIRFAFLSVSAVKSSVAAPEKYYELVGNERTGYRLSTKAAPATDYSCHDTGYGHVPPFPRETMLAGGADISPDTDPMDWIADWRESGEGYLPVSLPYGDTGQSDPDKRKDWPIGIESDAVLSTAESLGMPYVMLTRPMAFASDAHSRRKSKPTSLRRMRLHGLRPGSTALAILYGSDDCVEWQSMRSLDPHRESLPLTPPRSWWRLLLYGAEPFPASMALETYT